MWLKKNNTRSLNSINASKDLYPITTPERTDASDTYDPTSDSVSQDTFETTLADFNLALNKSHSV